MFNLHQASWINFNVYGNSTSKHWILLFFFAFGLGTLPKSFSLKKNYSSWSLVPDVPAPTSPEPTTADPIQTEIQLIRNKIENIKSEIYLFADTKLSSTYEHIYNEIENLRVQLQNIESDIPHVKYEKKLNIEESNNCHKLLEEKANFNTSCHDMLMNETANFQLKSIVEEKGNDTSMSEEENREEKVSALSQNDYLATTEELNASKLNDSKDVESSEDEEYVFVEESIKEVNKPFQVTSF